MFDPGSDTDTQTAQAKIAELIYVEIQCTAMQGKSVAKCRRLRSSL